MNTKTAIYFIIHFISIFTLVLPVTCKAIEKIEKTYAGSQCQIDRTYPLPAVYGPDPAYFRNDSENAVWVQCPVTVSVKDVGSSVLTLTLHTFKASEEDFLCYFRSYDQNSRIIETSPITQSYNKYAIAKSDHIHVPKDGAALLICLVPGQQSRLLTYHVDLIL